MSSSTTSFRSRSTSRLGLLGLATLIACVVLPVASASATPQYSWFTNQPAKGREAAGALVLPNDKVLVAGGTNSTYTTSPGWTNTTYTIYDNFGAGSWTAEKSFGTTSRPGQVSAQGKIWMFNLANGKALMVGGNSGTQTSQVYNPTADTWSAPVTATDSGTSPVCAQSGDKTVACYNPSGKITVYSEATDSWASKSATYLWAAPQFVGLDGDRFLKSGGYTAEGNVTKIYDVSADTWTTSGNTVDTLRYQGAALRLADGRVLVAGGNNGGSSSTSEIWDPATGTWTGLGYWTGDPSTAGSVGYPAQLVQDSTGLVHMMDGIGTYSAVFDPSTNLWIPGEYDGSGPWLRVGGYPAPAWIPGQYANMRILSDDTLMWIGGGTANSFAGALTKSAILGNGPASPVLTGAPAATTNVTTANISYTGVDGGVFTCSVDNGAYSACSSPYSTTGLTDGTHSLRVRVSSGGLTSIASNAVWTIDNTAPAAPTLGGTPTSPSSLATASITITGPETGVTYLCSLDDVTYTACTSPKAFSGLTDGVKTLYVKAKDAGGNIGVAASTTWTVDRTAPAAPTITGAPTGRTNVNSAALTFSAEAGATFQCSINSGAYSACTTPYSRTGITDGSFTIAVQAKDAAGNVSTATTKNWTVDTVAPAAPSITSGPSGTVSRTTASIAFTGEASATFTCSVDGGAYTSCSSPLALSDLAVGSHTVGIRATDLAGNTGPAVTRNWTIDSSAPAPTITSAPAAKVRVATASIAFTGLTDGTFQCSLDEASWTACTSPKTLSGIADGDHSFAVRVTDAMGQVSSSATASWSVKTTLPAAPSIAGTPASLTRLKSASLTVTAIEAGDTLSCSVDGGSYGACSAPITMSALAEGTHTVSARETDSFGNVSLVTTVSWTVDTVGPSSPTITGAPANNTSSTSATLNFTGEANGSFECKVNEDDWAPCTTPLELTGLLDGPQTVLVRQTDGAGNLGLEGQVSWTIGTTAPTPPAGAAGLRISGSGSFLVGGHLVFNGSRMEVNTVWPAGAKTETLSNAADFSNARTVTVGQTVNWQYARAFPNTAGTGTLYVKFAGDRRVNPNQVYTNEVNWDRVRPWLSLAARKRSLGFGANSWKVRLIGRDSGTGVGLSQFWMQRTGMPTLEPIGVGPGFVAAYGSIVTVPGDYQPIWTRVRDRVGNWSHWYLIR